MVVEVDVGKVLVVEWEKYEATAVRNYYSLTRKVTKGLVPCLDCRNRILFLCFQVIWDQNEKMYMQMIAYLTC